MTALPIPKGPVSPALTLPELVMVEHAPCQGEGCEECSHGQIEACSACGERPTVVCGEDACGCTMIGAQQPWEECEFCGDVVHPAEMVDGSCKTCWHRALTRYAHEIPPAILEAEVAWGKAVGWLE